MEVKAYIKNLRISPKKLRFIISKIKRTSPQEALDYLFYLPKKGAKIIYKALKSALDNAKNLNISQDKLRFKTFLVDEGVKLKRYRPGGKGMVKTIRRRYSHIKIILVDEKENNLSVKNINQSKKNKKIIIKDKNKINNKEVNKKDEEKEKNKLKIVVDKKKSVKKVNNEKKK